MRKTLFVNDEHYHIYNRGTDKRAIFKSADDIKRFLHSMEEFNTVEPIGSLYENFFRKNQLGSRASKLGKPKKLVEFICYCLNPNHYHFILKQVVDRGIEKFMHRLGTGYTKYFNQKYGRTGVLFQGAFKDIHIDSNEYLLHLSIYVNLNYKVHRLRSSASKSSWEEYIRGKKGLCEKDIILSQFKNPAEYRKIAEETLEDIVERRDLEWLLLE